MGFRITVQAGSNPEQMQAVRVDRIALDLYGIDIWAIAEVRFDRFFQPIYPDPADHQQRSDNPEDKRQPGHDFIEAKRKRKQHVFHHMKSLLSSMYPEKKPVIVMYDWTREKFPDFNFF